MGKIEEGKRYLIINADDFGACEETNKAIRELFQGNKITSTSLLAVGPARDEALQIAKEDNLKVGVHWAFNSDYENEKWKPCNARAAAGKSSFSLEDGCFSTSERAFAKKGKSKEVTEELIAQYKAIVDAGVEVDHADSHCGSLYGLVGRLFFYNAFDVCKMYDLPFRFSSGDKIFDILLGKTPPVVKWLKNYVYGVGKRRGVPMLKELICYSKKTVEVNCYKDLERFYLEKIRELPPGVSEFFAHPSYDCPRLEKKESWVGRLYDMEFMHSDAFHNMLKEEGIEKVSYDFISNKNKAASPDADG